MGLVWVGSCVFRSCVGVGIIQVLVVLRVLSVVGGLCCFGFRVFGGCFATICCVFRSCGCCLVLHAYECALLVVWWRFCVWVFGVFCGDLLRFSFLWRCLVLHAYGVCVVGGFVVILGFGVLGWCFGLRGCGFAD